MAHRRKGQKGRGDDAGQYVNLSYSLLQSEAWRTLSGPGVKVFLELRTRFNGGNNGRLHLSLEEAAGLLQLGKATVMRAFEELEERGLVQCIKRGQWYGRQASEWAVGDKSVNGIMPAYLWKRWRPDGAVRPSVLKWTRKTKRGAGVKPSSPTTGPVENREAINGCATEPVSSLRLVAIGSGMER